MSNEIINLDWFWIHQWNFDEFHFLCSVIKWYRKNYTSYEYSFEVSILNNHDNLLREIREWNHRYLGHISQEEFEENYKMPEHDEVEYELNDIRYAYPKVIDNYSLDDLVNEKVEKIELKISEDTFGIKPQNINSRIKVKEEFETVFKITFNFQLGTDWKNQIEFPLLQWQYTPKWFFKILRKKYSDYWLDNKKLEFSFKEIAQEYKIDIPDQEVFLYELFISNKIEITSISWKDVVINFGIDPIVNIDDYTKVTINDWKIKYEGKVIYSPGKDQQKILSELNSCKWEFISYNNLLLTTNVKSKNEEAFWKKMRRLNKEISDYISDDRIKIKKVKDTYSLDINLDNM